MICNLGERSNKEDVKDQVKLKTLAAAYADNSFEDGLRIDTALGSHAGPGGPVKPAV